MFEALGVQMSPRHPAVKKTILKGTHEHELIIAVI